MLENKLLHFKMRYALFRLTQKQSFENLKITDLWLPNEKCVFMMCSTFKMSTLSNKGTFLPYFLLKYSATF